MTSYSACRSGENSKGNSAMLLQPVCLCTKSLSNVASCPQHDICHFVDTSTIFSRHQKHTNSTSFETKNPDFYTNSQYFDTGLEFFTPAPHVVHVTNIRYGPESPPTNPFCWSNRLKLLLQLIWDVSLHNWRVHPLYSCTRLCFRLTFKQLSTYLMRRTLYKQVSEILLP